MYVYVHTYVLHIHGCVLVLFAHMKLLVVLKIFDARTTVSSTVHALELTKVEKEIKIKNNLETTSINLCMCGGLIKNTSSLEKIYSNYFLNQLWDAHEI